MSRTCFRGIRDPRIYGSGDMGVRRVIILISKYLPGERDTSDSYKSVQGFFNFFGNALIVFSAGLSIPFSFSVLNSLNFLGSHFGSRIRIRFFES